MKKFLFLNVFSVTFKLNTQCGERRISFLLFIIFIGSQIFTFNSKETRNNFEFRRGKNEIKMLLKFEKKIKQNIFFTAILSTSNWPLTMSISYLKIGGKEKIKTKNEKSPHFFHFSIYLHLWFEKVSFWIFAVNDFLT